MKININKIIVPITFLSVFIFPTYIMIEKTGIDITKYIFFLCTFLIYILVVLYNKKDTLTELIMLLILIVVSIIKKSIEPASLIELILIYKIIDVLKLNEKPQKKLLHISIMGVLFYSLLYFNYNGRYIYTGLREINQSGFAILMLALLIRKINKRLGNIFILLGLLTFSRNYLLCLMVFIALECIKKTKIYTKLYKILTFKNLTIGSIAFLILISGIFEIAYENNRLVEYKQGIQKYIYIFDYSNYFRFTTNTNLIKMYVKYPEKILTGITEEEFLEYNYNFAVEENKRYRAIKPHNYFFSYLRIYGIFSIAIFAFLNQILKKVINKNNFPIFIVIFIYSIILGIGFANYWLYLSIITLIAYSKGEEKNERFNYYNKDISKKKCIN